MTAKEFIEKALLTIEIRNKELITLLENREEHPNKGLNLPHGTVTRCMQNYLIEEAIKEAEADRAALLTTSLSEEELMDKAIEVYASMVTGGSSALSKRVVDVLRAWEGRESFTVAITMGAEIFIPSNCIRVLFLGKIKDKPLHAIIIDNREKDYDNAD